MKRERERFYYYMLGRVVSDLNHEYLFSTEDRNVAGISLNYENTNFKGGPNLKDKHWLSIAETAHAILCEYLGKEIECQISMDKNNVNNVIAIHFDFRKYTMKEECINNEEFSPDAGL